MLLKYFLCYMGLEVKLTVILSLATFILMIVKGSQLVRERIRDMGQTSFSHWLVVLCLLSSLVHYNYSQSHHYPT